FARARLASARRSREPASVEGRSRMASTTQQTPLIPAKAGIQGQGLGPRYGVPATRASRGAPARGRAEESVSLNIASTRLTAVFKSAYRVPPVTVAGRTVGAGRQLWKRSNAVAGRIASTAPARQNSCKASTRASGSPTQPDVPVSCALQISMKIHEPRRVARSLG